MSIVNTNNILSPVTYKKNVSIISKILIKDIQTLYNQLGIDISKYFAECNLVSVYLCRCNDTGYEFFYPENIVGDSGFYGLLEKIPWYYMEDKWEFSQGALYINGDDKVLEIGSGNGSFVKMMKSKGIFINGLELSQSAVNHCIDLNLPVYNETLHVHSRNKKEFYDVVCAFQLMEHLYDIKSFIEDCLHCLKIGGKLILSVPNYSSFIKYDNFNPLEYPPHHMGRWNEESLKKIQSVFQLDGAKIIPEKLAEYHKEYFLSIFAREFKDIARTSLVKLIDENRIKGHTVLAVFTKVDKLSNNALTAYNALKIKLKNND